MAQPDIRFDLTEDVEVFSKPAAADIDLCEERNIRLVRVDVVRDFEPGLDVILVNSTDERFVHTGPVAGCSGSPVYINGRLAGALAYAWTYAKDPLYGVTPIGEMLKVGLGGQTTAVTQNAGQGWPVFDFSKPIDLTEVYRQFKRDSDR